MPALFNEVLRSGDIVARLGGDEFGVLLVNCNVESARKVGEKMRIDIDNFEFEWEGRKFKLGVSIGVVAITRQADSIETLIGHADTSCYIAKQKGRNQIHLHTAD